MTAAVVKARTGGNYTAYARVDDFAGIAAGFARCRTRQDFIASQAALDARATSCAVCGEAITDESNRGEYDPRTRRYVVMHYECSWTATIGELFELADEGRIG